MKQMHILHIGGSLTQEVDTLFSIREKSCWKSSKVCFSRYIYQSQYEFQILLCLWKSKQYSLSFPRNRYLILKYFYSTKKIDTSAEWMKLCLMSYHMCAKIFCGNPVWRKTFLISMPETNPSLSESVVLNRALYRYLSPALTTQGMASTDGAFDGAWLTAGCNRKKSIVNFHEKLVKSSYDAYFRSSINVRNSG